MASSASVASRWQRAPYAPWSFLTSSSHIVAELGDLRGVLLASSLITSQAAAVSQEWSLIYTTSC